MKRTWLFIPLAVALGIIGLLFVIYHTIGEDTPQRPMVGQSVPSLELKGLDEGEINLEDLTGHPYLLHVGASWCEACQEEIPVLNEIAQYDISIVGVLYKDNPDTVQQWLDDVDNPYELVLLDESGDALVNLGGDALPISYLVDEDGVIRAIIPGGLVDAHQVLDKL